MRSVPDGGMRALPGPSGSGGGDGGGYGASYSGGGSEIQPGLWILPLAGFAALNGGAWLLDQATAAWCHVEGGACVSTHYLSDLLHLYTIIVGCAVTLAAAAIGYRRRWHARLGRALLYLLAVAALRIRAARARAAAERRTRGTTVRVEVIEGEVIGVEDADPRLPLPAAPHLNVPDLAEALASRASPGGHWPSTHKERTRPAPTPARRAP